MSGDTCGFYKGKVVKYKGKKTKVKEIYFTSNGGAHNSDMPVLVLENGVELVGMIEVRANIEELKEVDKGEKR